MADNSSQGGSDVIRDIDKGSLIKTQVFVLDAGGAGAESLVTQTNPLPSSINASIFRFSTNNSTVAQLAAGATFTGVFETALDQPSISLLLTSDQPSTLTIKQSSGVAGAGPVKDIVFYVAANEGLSGSFPLNGNYIEVVLKNTGLATTTTLALNTAYGNLPSADSNGRLPISSPDCIQLLNQTITVAGLSTTIDTIGYASVVVQLSNVWQGNGFFESSNNNTDWNTCLAYSRDFVSLQDIITSNGMFVVKPTGRYLRFNVPSLLGTLVITAIGRQGEGFNSADLLSLAMDKNNGAPLNVSLMGVKQDTQGALIASDATTYVKVFSGTTDSLIIDTQGYQSAAIFMGGGTASGTIDCSPDLNPNSFIPMSAIGYSGAGSATVSANLSGKSFTPTSPFFAHVPCSYRYIRVTLASYTSGAVYTNVCLRQTPVSPNSNLGASQIVGGSLGDNVAVVASTGVGAVQVMGIMRTGLLASPSTSNVARLALNLSGALIIENHAVRELTWKYAAPASGLLSTTTAVTVNGAVASQRGNITSIQIQSEAVTTATEFAIRDGAAGTVMWRMKIPTTGLPLTQLVFDPPLAQAAVNTLMEIVTLTATGAGAVYFNAQGFMSN